MISTYKNLPVELIVRKDHRKLYSEVEAWDWCNPEDEIQRRVKGHGRGEKVQQGCIT
jgi:hypothetical protein